jgi:hypothetical protein
MSSPGKEPKLRFRRQSSHPWLVDATDAMRVSVDASPRTQGLETSTIGAGLEYPFVRPYALSGDSKTKPPWRMKAEHYGLNPRSLQHGFDNEWLAGLMNVLGAMTITFNCLWTVRARISDRPSATQLLATGPAQRSGACFSQASARRARTQGRVKAGAHPGTHAGDSFRPIQTPSSLTGFLPPLPSSLVHRAPSSTVSWGV